MKSWSMVAAVVVTAFLCPAGAQAGMLAQWTQYRADGALELRLATDEASCPSVTVAGQSLPTGRRAEPSKAFPVLLCGAPLTGNPAPIDRILVIGDTGCRILGAVAQPCNDPDGWPFGRVARSAAAMKPDLIIHVGDYLYREIPCPAGNEGCAGSPWGDNWATWQADFFTPAAPLLQAAPWIFVRGNHETCDRAGPGWTRILGPAAFEPGKPCAVHLPPYLVKAGATDLAVIDNANAPEAPPDPALTPIYRAEFDALAQSLGGPTWYLMHRPLRGVVRLKSGQVTGGNYTILPALPRGLPPQVELLLAGHIHAFEAIDYAAGPPQIIAGDSGDLLDMAPADLTGIEIGGLEITNGLYKPGFGFLILTRKTAGWQIEAFDDHGALIQPCALAAHFLTCPSP